MWIAYITVYKIRPYLPCRRILTGSGHNFTCLIVSPKLNKKCVQTSYVTVYISLIFSEMRRATTSNWGRLCNPHEDSIASTSLIVNMFAYVWIIKVQSGEQIVDTNEVRQLTTDAGRRGQHAYIAPVIACAPGYRQGCKCPRKYGRRRNDVLQSTRRRVNGRRLPHYWNDSSHEWPKLPQCDFLKPNYQTRLH